MRNYITYEQLAAHKPCKEIEKFRKMFGDKLYITPDIAEQYAHVFTANFAILNLLTKEELAEYGRRVHQAVKTFNGTKDDLKRLKARIAAEVYCYGTT
jgi:hypothetical protein